MYSSTSIVHDVRTHCESTDFESNPAKKGMLILFNSDANCLTIMNNHTTNRGVIKLEALRLGPRLGPG